MAEAPEKNLALDIVRITEAAALASARWLGRGDKEAGDGAAVDAMRISFSTLHIDGMVVIGEGEKDNAPMLYNGEKVGMGDGPRLDVAVDPVEGTNLLAYGRPNAISVVGVAPKALRQKLLKRDGFWFCFSYLAAYSDYKYTVKPATVK